MTLKYLKYIFISLSVFFAAAFSASAQEVVREEQEDILPSQDSTMLAVIDSTARADSLALLEKSSLKAPAFTSAGDSIVEVFTGGRRLIYYYGGVTVQYENVSITSDYMEYDMDTGIVYARGTLDTLSGEWKGRPQMTQGSSVYDMEEVHYNFNTQKAYITNMVTNDSEGEIRGDRIQMNPDRSINMMGGIYTVCDLEEPHYYMKMSSAKVITDPNQKTVFGPAWMVLGGVPLPLVIPFGFIPPNPERSTGLLTPTFGEEKSRGFYMRDAGIYLVLGQYFDLSLTGSVYTLGSWSVDVNSRYKVNYKFNGGVSFTYSHDQTGEKDSPDFFQTSNFSVRWTHAQDAKARPGTNFSASVNFSSPSNSRYNSRSVDEALQNQISSSISYSKNWDGRFNLSINALHSQNSRDSSYTFTLPNISFSMSTIYPFKQKNRVGKERIYEKISIGYNTSLQNKISFKASEFGEPGFYDRFQNGMTHNFSIGLPSFTLFNYININPTISYGMNWFFRARSYVYDPESEDYDPNKDAPIRIDGPQFGHFGITQRYSGSISANTRLYGMFNFGRRGGKLQAIRHVISPSVSLSVAPELGTYANGWRTLEYVDKNGVQKSYSYNIYEGQMNAAPGKGKSASMNISIGNNIEAKVRDTADTTGTGTKKVKIIDQLTFNTGINLLADSLKMNMISASLTTTIFQKLTLNLNASMDPYAVDENGRRCNTFNIVKEGLLHPVRVNSANLSFSYSFQGKGSFNGNDGTEGNDMGSGSTLAYQQVFYHPVTGEYIPGGWLYYMNPNSPWNLNASFSFGYNRSYGRENDQLVTRHNFSGTVSLSGNLQLTPRMSMTANSGFDFIARRITTSSINFTYDLHCFNIAVSWVPTGQWQSYSFRISANASALADILRYKKSSSFWDN